MSPRRRCRRLLRHPAQHSVDKPGISRGASVSLRKPHRQVDRRMIGNFKPENLRRAEQQDGFGARRVRGKSLFEVSADQMPKSAEPPQHRCGEPTRQGSVAVGKSWTRPGCAFLPERSSSSAIRRRRTPSRISAAIFGRRGRELPAGGGARTRHTPIVAGKLCRGRELRPKTRNAQFWSALIVRRPRVSSSRRSGSPISQLHMRAQPWKTKPPIEAGRLVTWVACSPPRMVRAAAPIGLLAASPGMTSARPGLQRASCRPHAPAFATFCFAGY